MKKKTKDKSMRLEIRLSSELKKKLKALADAEGRSMANFIKHLLELTANKKQ